MKKITLILIIFLIMLSTTTIVKAKSTESMIEEIYSQSTKYGVTQADKVKAERLISEYKVTEEQANQIYEKAKEALKFLEDAGVTDVKKLNTQLNIDQKRKFQSLCQQAADIVDATLTYKNGAVEVYKNGKKIETFTFTDGKLAYTGNNINIFLMVPLASIIAIFTVIITRKKLANV